MPHGRLRLGETGVEKGLAQRQPLPDHVDIGSANGFRRDNPTPVLTNRQARRGDRTTPRSEA